MCNILQRESLISYFNCIHRCTYTYMVLLRDLSTIDKVRSIYGLWFGLLMIEQPCTIFLRVYRGIGFNCTYCFVSYQLTHCGIHVVFYGDLRRRQAVFYGALTQEYHFLMLKLNTRIILYRGAWRRDLVL